MAIVTVATCQFPVSADVESNLRLIEAETLSKSRWLLGFVA